MSCGKNSLPTKRQRKYSCTIICRFLKNIDSALADPAIAHQFINNSALNLKIIAPEGVLSRDLNDVAWQIAKQNNIFTKLDLSTVRLLTTIYDNQQRIMRSEGEIARVLESWESRQPENLRTTLILVKKITSDGRLIEHLIYSRSISKRSIN